MCTLENVSQVKKALKDKFKVQKVFVSTKVCDLSKLPTEKEENFYYFGVITNGNNQNDVVLNSDDNQIINITSNSQIIELFQSITHSEQELKGQFRGWELYFKN